MNKEMYCTLGVEWKKEKGKGKRKFRTSQAHDSNSLSVQVDLSQFLII